MPILADGIEHIIQLNPSQPTRLQFNMPGPHYPLWMYVTPCGGSVHWQLFHVQASHDTEQLANVHPKASKFNYLLHARIPPLVEVESNTIAEPLRLLAGEADDKRMSFYSQQLDSGDYDKLLTISDYDKVLTTSDYGKMLTISDYGKLLTISDYESVVLVLSSNAHSTARVFITTRKWRLDEHYPPRPADTTVSYEVANYRRHSEFNDAATVRIKWNIPLEISAMNSNSTKTDRTPLNRYRFCAVVSRKQPDWTICDELGENLESIHCVNQSSNTLDIDNMRVRVFEQKYYAVISEGGGRGGERERDLTLLPFFLKV
ncbi:unnamed protein product [Toxocara canis]|uniref:DPPIV_N domain-containing protein n=1 Tax=Toxocara canis TaxID=6265 RepID=A0A183V754_TOXCA|nr:unnamed protein product [Toxocara canis]